MAMRLSYSQISAHRTCPQSWAFSHLNRLERDETGNPPVELDYGTWWHALLAADAIERGRDQDTLLFDVPPILSTPAGPLRTAGVTPREVITAAATWWIEGINQRVVDVWEARLGIADLGPHLTRRFADWKTMWADHLADEEPLAVELVWERDLPGAPGVTLTGTIDLVYRDVRRDIIVIRDNKTGKTLEQGSTSLGDMMDAQLHLYAWGASPALSLAGLDPVRALSYDRARSTAAKEPKLTTAGKLSKSVTDYSAFDYERWVTTAPTYERTKAAGAGTGTYEREDDVVERLFSPDELRKWFQRSLDLVNGNVIAAHVQEAVHTARDIKATIAVVTAGGGPGRNLTRACQWCPYAKLCRSQMIGGRDGEYDLAVLGLREKENTTT